MSSVLDRIVFVPVIHTDAQSVDKARRTIRMAKPDVVAVELDHQRYHQLMNRTNESSFESPQPTGDVVQDLMMQIAQFQGNLGTLMESDAGTEMLASIEEGRAIGAKIALVDRPIQDTVQAMMQVPLDEVYRLLELIPLSSDEFEEGEAGLLLESLRDGSKVDEILTQFRNEFPHLSDVLINQRDEYVARALHAILKDVEGKIVVVVGAAHCQGVKKALERLLERDAGS